MDKSLKMPLFGANEDETRNMEIPRKPGFPTAA